MFLLSLHQISPYHVYDEISAQPIEEDDSLYSSVQLPNNRDALYSQIQPHQPQEEEQSPDAVVSFTPKTTPEQTSVITNDSDFVTTQN